MSNNYQTEPLLTNNDEDVNGGFNHSVSERMVRPQGRPRYIKAYYFLIRRNITLLTISCVISTLIFFVIFYSSVDYISHLYSYKYPIHRTATEQNSKSISFNQDEPKRKKGLSMFDKNIKYQDFNYLNPTSLTYDNRTYSGDLQILFRFPKKRSINSLLLIFHGCGRSAHNWFHTIERQRIIGAAIDLGFACLAFQATDQFNRCWSSESDININEDAKMVIKGLENFYKEYPSLESLPRFTFGASSGGIFSSIFAINQRYKIQGQILFISIVYPDVLEIYVKEKRYPPTAWIYMSRDIEFASESRIKASMRIFEKENISHIGFDIEPIRLIPSIFHDRIPTITDETSRYIFYRLQQNHWLDPENYLIHNPRREYSWQQFLFTTANETVITPTILENLRNHEDVFPDFLNTIYGEHEISFERSFEALKWLQKFVNN